MEDIPIFTSRFESGYGKRGLHQQRQEVAQDLSSGNILDGCLCVLSTFCPNSLAGVLAPIPGIVIGALKGRYLCADVRSVAVMDSSFLHLTNYFCAKSLLRHTIRISLPSSVVRSRRDPIKDNVHRRWTTLNPVILPLLRGLSWFDGRRHWFRCIKG